MSRWGGDTTGMRARRLIAVALVLTTVIGLAVWVGRPPKPPPVPLSWASFRPPFSMIMLDEDGRGSVQNLPLATSVGADCASSEVRRFSGEITWRMIADGEGVLVADGVVVAFQAKWSFGVVDWSTVYINSCTRDPNLDGWTTYIGGTGP